MSSLNTQKLNCHIPDGATYIEDSFIKETLAKVDLKTLIGNIIEILDGKPSRYNQVNAFKNGFTNNTNKELVKSQLASEKFSELDTSLRVTNIQNLNPEIKKVQLYLYKNFNLPSSCNLYLTPSSTANCFNFHSDYQEALIYQIQGQKKWTIPLDEKNAPLLTIKEDDPYENKEKLSFDIKKHDLFSLSHSIIHKAEFQGNEVSVHLTFAIQKTNEYDIANLIIQDLYGGSNIKPALSRFVKNDIDSIVDDVSKKIQNYNVDSFKKKTEKLLTQRELLLIKKGRLY